jgi:hypothetical protein
VGPSSVRSVRPVPGPNLHRSVPGGGQCSLRSAVTEPPRLVRENGRLAANWVLIGTAAQFCCWPVRSRLTPGSSADRTLRNCPSVYCPPPRVLRFIAAEVVNQRNAQSAATAVRNPGDICHVRCDPVDIVAAQDHPSQSGHQAVKHRVTDEQVTIPEVRNTQCLELRFPMINPLIIRIRRSDGIGEKDCSRLNYGIGCVVGLCERECWQRNSVPPRLRNRRTGRTDLVFLVQEVQLPENAASPQM